MPSNGKEHILVTVEALTRYVHLETVKNTSAKGVVKAQGTVFDRYGKTEIVVPDRGTAFTAKLTGELLRANECRYILTSPQHACSNGLAERNVQEASRPLSLAMCEKEDHRDLAAKLTKLRMCVNRVVPQSTGKSRFESLHGYTPRINNHAQMVENLQEKVWVPPEELRKDTRENSIRSHDKYAYYYDLKRRPYYNYQRLQIGDAVAVERAEKSKGWWRD